MTLDDRIARMIADCSADEVDMRQIEDTAKRILDEVEKVMDTDLPLKTGYAIFWHGRTSSLYGDFRNGVMATFRTARTEEVS